MTNNTNPVVGWIEFYDRDKQFGFASLVGSSQQVFFHQSNCREVEGTPEEPILTNCPSDQQPRWFRRTQRIERIVLRVVQDHKGPRAAVWGFVPVRTWLEELLHFDMLKRYEGGIVSITHGDRCGGHGHLAHIEQGRLMNAPQLEPGDPWVLSLEYRVEEMQDRIAAILELRPLNRRTIFISFGLEEAFPSKRMPHGCYAMDVWDEPEEAWARIVFRLPEG